LLFWFYDKETTCGSYIFTKTIDGEMGEKRSNMIFIDLEKAYDKVSRKVMWWLLKKKQISNRYIFE